MDRDATSGTEGANQLGDVLTSLESLLHLERGLKFGLARDYRSAERELKLAERSEWNNPSLHDLRARLYSQQGRFEEAEVSWTTALQLDPGNNAYEAGLDRVRKDMNRPRLLRWPLSVLATLIVSMLVLALGLGAFGYAYRIESSVAALAAQVDDLQRQQELHWESTSGGLDSAVGDMRSDVAESVEPIGGKVDAVATTVASMSFELAELRSQQSALQSQIRSSSAILPVVQTEGVRLEPADQRHRIVFEQAIFSEGAEFDQPAFDLLIQLGNQLETIQGDFLIVVTGAVQSSECSECLALSVARAEAVVRFLIEHTDLTATDLVIGHPGESPPHPEDTVESASRNRTVVIELIPLGG